MTMAQSKHLSAPLATTKMPPSVPYILANEGAERFAFYGMYSILVIFMTNNLLGANGVLKPMVDESAKACSTGSPPRSTSCPSSAPSSRTCGSASSRRSSGSRWRTASGSPFWRWTTRDWPGRRNDPDRHRVRRHQALRLRQRRRPVRGHEQAPDREDVQLVLLLDQRGRRDLDVVLPDPAGQVRPGAGFGVPAAFMVVATIAYCWAAANWWTSLPPGPGHGPGSSIPSSEPA